MKLILAIINASRLEAVKEALNDVEVFRLTMVDVQGFGRQRGQSEVYRGQDQTSHLVRKVQLQIAVNEDFVELTVNVQALIWPSASGCVPVITRSPLFATKIEFEMLELSIVSNPPE